MNPLTNVKNLQKMNERMLEMGVEDNQGWHKQYKDSAYIFIGGLPYDLTEGDILCVFSQYGEIVNINLVRDKKTGKTKGFCFLCYEDQRSTILAVDNFNGIKLGGRIIRVDHCANYRRPKSDEKDEHGNYKEIIEEGCAPKTPSPSPPASEDEEDILELPKKRKKEKKAKKQKKHKEEKLLKKKKTTASSDEEDDGEKKKLDLFQKDLRSDRILTVKDKRDRTERDFPRDSDLRDLKVSSSRNNTHDRVERDFRGDHRANREEYDSRSDNRRDMRVHERDHEKRHHDREVRERDHEMRDRERDIHERDVGNARDRHERYVGNARDRDYRDNPDRRAPVNRREQKDRAYHTTRDDRDREEGERRKDRSDRRRDYREDEGKRHRDDYSDRKDRR